MAVRLDKEVVVSLYCYCREAERSVHRAIGDPWPEFQRYYSPEKTAAICKLIEEISEVAGTPMPCPSPAAREAEFGIGPWRFFLRYWFGRWLARWESAWSFPQREVCYFLGRLEGLLRLLITPAKPDTQSLIALRMAFYQCEWIIGRRCYGLPELELADRIDHFNKTEWLPRVTLDDVLRMRA